jgi:hypothetical protein
LTRLCFKQLLRTTIGDHQADAPFSITAKNRSSAEHPRMRDVLLDHIVLANRTLNTIEIEFREIVEHRTRIGNRPNPSDNPLYFLLAWRSENSDLHVPSGYRIG